MRPSTVPKRSTERRRRNVVEQSQADRVLPASGRKGRPPKAPIRFGPAGAALWTRLWTSPQATMWGRSHLDGVAKRCVLEDMLDDIEAHEALRVIAEIRQWEDRWGFNPRALASLHLMIEDDAAKDETPPNPTGVVDIRDRLRDAAG